MFKNRFINSLLPVILIFVLCVPVVLPYFNNGYFPTHDGEWAVVRLADMFRSLRDLQFPVRFSGALNFGYGYPLFNFAYPFPYYLGILFYLPFHSFVISIKTMFVLSVFLSAVFMYMASFALWKDRVSAFVSSVIYIYLPYRMVDLYVRGSLGESISFAIFPLIFYFTLKLFDSPFARFTVILLSLSIAALIMTHNIMTVLFLPVLITFILIRIFSEKRYDVLQTFLLSLLMGFGISAFFWFPALFEKNNILLSKIPIADRSIYFVNLKQLLIPSWGYAPPTESGGFSYQLGVVQTLIVIFSLIVLFFSLIKNKLTQTPVKFYALVISVIYLLCFTMLFSFTSAVWKATPLLKEINYPWTLLSQLGFLTALLSGFLVLHGKILKYLLLSFSLISIILVFQYAKPQNYVNRGENYYLTNEATTTSSRELMPLWVKEFPNEHYKDKVEVISGNAVISNLKYNSKELKFTYTSSEDSIFRINTIYYPGWKAYIDNEETKINYQNSRGVMEINGSKYRSKVSLYFRETLVRITADVISILSISVLLFILLRPILRFK